MSFAIRVTLKKSSMPRQLLGVKHAYMRLEGASHFNITDGNFEYEGKLFCNPRELKDATLFSYGNGEHALQRYIEKLGNRQDNWVKNPKLVEVDA